MTMMNVSILDEEFADNASMQIRIKQLEDENKSLTAKLAYRDDILSECIKNVDEIWENIYHEKPLFIDPISNMAALTIMLDAICGDTHYGNIGKVSLITRFFRSLFNKWKK